MANQKQRPLATWATAFVFVLTASVVLAQDATVTDSSSGKTLSENWENFLHFVKVARPDLAGSYGEAILQDPGKGGELYALSIQTPGVQDILARAARLEGLAETVQRITRKIEAGYQADRSDPKQIAVAIEMLDDSVRAYELAAERLTASAEYALPQLIHKLADSQTGNLMRERIVTVLPRMAKKADVASIAGLVRGLSAAMQVDDPKVQEIVAGALGRIGYPHAAARLKELALREGVLDRTRRVALASLVACAGESALNKSVSELFYDTAQKYYYQVESVAPDRRFDTANVWYWTEGLGLTYKPVPREIFCDIYAMRMARAALQHDEKFENAVSLWIAADLKRHADLPAGAVDSTSGDEKPSARFFALAGSSGYQQEVLTRALNDGDTAVVLGAVEALVRTAGSKSLVQPTAGGAQPLVQALTYPDRQVRFLAAVSLANALPQARFAGSEQVVTVLNEAIRQTGSKTALLAVADEAKSNALKDALRSAGYEVIDQPDHAKAISEARGSAGVDVVVLADKPDAAGIVRALRSDPALVTVPVVLTVRSKALDRLATRDRRIVFLEGEPTQPAMAAVLAQAAQKSIGKVLTAEQASEWAIRAAKAVEKLAETGNRAYDLSRSLPALVAALKDPRGPIRVAAADALAAMPQAEAQRPIADLAVDEAAGDPVRIKAFAALSGSLRRFGNQLTAAQAQAVLDVVRSSDGAEALREAAAQALGAMNLPSDRIKELILQANRDT